MINPRLIANVVPIGKREGFFNRAFNSRQRHFEKYFDSAPLLFAPGTRMVELIVGCNICGQIAINGFYELELSRRVVELARAGGTLLDVGANVGYFSMLWCGNGAANKSIAVEASPRNQALIARNCEANGFTQRVQLARCAAGNKKGEASFDFGPADQTGWGGIVANATSAPTMVRMERLDDIVGSQEISVLKIDIEGAEFFALQGAQRVLARRSLKVVFFEENPYRMGLLGIAEGSVLELLRGNGFVCTRFERSEMEWMAVRP